MVLPEIQKQKSTVFENDTVEMKCPSGNIPSQKWFKCFNASCKLKKYLGGFVRNEELKYMIEKAELTDEGTYACFEGNAVLLYFTLHVNGNLCFMNLITS